MRGWSAVLLVATLLGPGQTESGESEESVARGVRQLVAGHHPRPPPPPQLDFLPEFYQRPDPTTLTDIQFGLTCLACETAVASIIDLYILGVDFDTIVAGLEGLCDLLGIIEKEVCQGGIENYAPIIEYIVVNRLENTGAE